MTKLLWLLPLAAIAGGFWWIQVQRNAPPEVSVTKPQRERLVSAVATNGKVEPLEWVVVRSEREGTVTKLSAQNGQQVTQGAVLAELETTEAKNELATAEARIAQAKAELELLNSGGRTRDIAEIDSAAERARQQIATLQPQLESLQRLVAKKAATQSEVDQIRSQIEQQQIELRNLQKRRETLVSVLYKATAQARLREAETAATQARHRITLGTIRAPLSGTLYQLEIRTGAYLRPGDPLGNIGKLDRVRVRVYVDEPEVGNIRVGQPVAITWDALPGRQWSGAVEKLPTQIIALGARQVGEAICIIENPERVLIPQTNVNVEIRTSVVENALTIPKEVLRRDRGETGVYVVQPDSRVIWRKVQLGAASITRIEVKEGLGGNEQVLLPTDVPLKDGLLVKVNADPQAR
jgi:HlyD family secretion protein